jgi:hypothetical protein
VSTLDPHTLAGLLRRARSAWDGRAGEARMITAERDRAAAEIGRLTVRADYLDQISGLLNTYADQRQADVHTQVESVVSQGLRQVFGEDLALRLVTRAVGRRTETDFVLVSGTGDAVLETPILDARGGGVAAVAGFLINAVLVLLTPGMRPLLVLDEAFAQVSAEYEEPLADFIAELCARSGLQVVLVTHSPAYSGAADRQYRFTQAGGVTTATDVSEPPQ